MPLPQLVSRSNFVYALIVAALLAITLPGAYASRSELVCNPRSLAFGKVVTGQSLTLPVTLSNTGSSSVTLYAVNLSGVAFMVNNLAGPLILAPGQTVPFSVSFSPSALGSTSGVLTISSSAGNLNFYMEGKGVADWGLTANPSSLAFGNVKVGGFSTLQLTISNPGTSTQTVSIGKVGGTGFSVSGITLPLILPAGQSFTFNVTFAPLAAGAASGSIVATSPLNPSLTIPLSGAGIPAAGLLTVSPISINFGNVTIGRSATQNGQLTAASSSVTVSSASLSNTAFQLIGLSLPITLSAGQSVNFTVSFTPQNNGSDSGTLSFGSDASNSPTVESLAGTGSPVQYSVNLSWDSGGAPEIEGYNVYRGSQSGGPYSRINSGLDPNTAYTDTSVVPGQTYYYVTTAVNSQGQESTYSNPVQAVIP
jgi:Abnormal spindle-like microcephaly-assoc'd, ASPM-SPD-2-Hydin